MIDCINADVRDALPDFVHGRLSELDRINVEEHVASCGECREELGVLRAVRAAMPIAPPVDIARVARAIAPYPAVTLAGDANERPTRGIAPHRWLLAATVVAVIAAGWAAMSLRQVSGTGGQRAAQVSPVAEVVPAKAGTGIVAEVAAVKSPVAADADPGRVVSQVASLSFVGGTQGLSNSDLEQLVADLEGMDAIPAAEPRSVTAGVELAGEEQ